MKLVVDIRETKVIACLREIKVPFETSPLPVGDFIVGDDIVIERKTVQDLNNSLKDGRFRDQRTRLESTRQRVFYILEQSTREVLSKQAQGAVVSLAERGFSVLPSVNESNTASLLATILRRATATSVNPTTSPNCIVGDKKLSRSSKTTPETCAVAQLCQIPGISRGFADKIQMAMPTATGIVPIAEAILRRDPEIIKILGNGKRLEKTITYLYGRRNEGVKVFEGQEEQDRSDGSSSEGDPETPSDDARDI